MNSKIFAVFLSGTLISANLLSAQTLVTLPEDTSPDTSNTPSYDVSASSFTHDGSSHQYDNSFFQSFSPGTLELINLDLGIKTYIPSPLLPPYVTTLTVGKNFGWGNFSFGELSYKLFGDLGTTPLPDHTLVPLPVSGSFGDMNGLGGQTTLHNNFGSVAIAITDANYNPLTPNQFPNPGILNGRAEETSKLGSFTFSALEMTCSGYRLPHQSKVGDTQTLGGTLSYTQKAGLLDLKLGTAIAHNNHEEWLMSGSLDTSCQSISKLHFNLTVSELTRPNAPTVLGVQSLLGCPFGKGWSSMLGAGIQTPNNGYIFLGMNYTFGPHL